MSSLAPRAALAHFPETFGGYKEGTYASVDYSAADGEQDFQGLVWAVRR